MLALEIKMQIKKTSSKTKHKQEKDENEIGRHELMNNFICPANVHA